MKEFLLLFWNESGNGQYQLDPLKMKAIMQSWQDWIGAIAAEGKLISTKPILWEGVTVSNSGTQRKPSIKENQMVTGYMLCRSANREEVMAWANSCPILQHAGGFTEIREVAPFEI